MSLVCVAAIWQYTIIPGFEMQCILLNWQLILSETCMRAKKTLSAHWIAILVCAKDKRTLVCMLVTRPHPLLPDIMPLWL